MMKRSPFGKYISFLMVVVILAISVTGYCCGTNAGPLTNDNSRNSCSDSYFISLEKDCLSYSIDKTSAPAHIDVFCDCLCHTPLIPLSVQVGRSQKIDLLNSLELFTALPEVYLEKFIPPRILV